MNEIIYEDILNMRQRCRCMEGLRNRVILITGATGFVGSFIVRVLAIDALLSDTQTKILAMVRNVPLAQSMFKEYIEKGYVELIHQDITEAIILQRDVDYIIHCASNAGPREYAEDPIGTILTNCIGTENVLRFACGQKACRVLYLSTIEVYGVVEKEGPVTENQQGIVRCNDVRSCYPLSKQVCENLCIAYMEQKNLSIVIGRLSYLYGPGMRKDDSKVVAEFTRNAANGQDLILKSRGQQKRSYCYISDAVAGLLTVLVHGKAGEAYNISSEKNVTTIAGIAETLVKIFDYKNLSIRYEAIDDWKGNRAYDAILDNAKLKALGWESFVGLKEGLMRTVRSIETD